MTESDDSLFGGGGGGVDIPNVQAERVKTAERVGTKPDQDKRNRRLAASVLTKDWQPAKLGSLGLFGMGKSETL